MSDDTPTQRFPEPGGPEPGGTGPTAPIPPASADEPTAPIEPTPPTGPTAPLGDDAPTQRFEPPAPPPAPDATAGGEEPKKSKALLYTLIGIGAALLIAIIVLLFILFTSGNPEPGPTSASPSITPSETPSETPSASPSATEEPPPLPGPSIASFTADPTTVDCAGVTTAPVTFAWETTGTALWFAPDAPDASAGGAQFPTTFTQEFNYECGQASAQRLYTITVQGENGEKASQSVIVRETS